MGIPVSDPENISTMKFLLAVLTLFAASACAYPQWGLRDKRSADAEPVPEANAQPEADAWYGYYGYPSTYGYSGYYGLPYGYYRGYGGYYPSFPGRGKRSANPQYQPNCYGCCSPGPTRPTGK